MSGSDFFDPYRKWFGIRDAERPPNHYRLLGIEPFEDDLDVIQNGADQRMAYLRQFQTGQHSALSQRLLNEVTKAKICLLNSKKKAKYDQQLKAADAARVAASAPANELGLAEAEPEVEQGKPVGRSSSVSVSADELDELLNFAEPSQASLSSEATPPAPASPLSGQVGPSVDAPTHRQTIDASGEETLDLGLRNASAAVLPALGSPAPAPPDQGRAMAPAVATGSLESLGGFNSVDPLAGLSSLPAPSAGAPLPSLLARRQEPANSVADFFKSTAGVVTLAVGVPVVLLLVVLVIMLSGSKPKPNVLAEQGSAEVQATSAATSETTTSATATVEATPESSGAATSASPVGSGAVAAAMTPPQPTELRPTEPYPTAIVTGAPAPPAAVEAAGMVELAAGGIATGFIKGGAQAVVVTWDGQISVYDFASSSEVGSRFGPARRLAAAAVSPLGDVALLAGEEGGLELWETTGRTLAARFDLQAERPESALVTSIAFSPDGRTAATVGVDKILRIWTIGREAAVAVIPTPDAVPRSVAVSNGGRAAAVGSDDGMLRVWSVETRASLAALPAHSGAVRALAFSPIGDLLVSGGDDGSIQTWSVSVAGPATAVLHRGGEAVRTLAVSQDGRWLLAGGGASYRNGAWPTALNPPSLQLWDLVNRTQTRALAGHRATIETVAFSATGPQALSSGFDGALRLWNLPEIASGAGTATGAMAANSGSPPLNPGTAPNVDASRPPVPTPLNAGLSPADLTPQFALDPTGWLATTQAVLSAGPVIDAPEAPAAPPGFEKYWRTRELPAPIPLLTEEAWETYNQRFGQHAADLAKSGAPEDTRRFARELLGEAQLIAGREPGTQAFLTARAFALAVGRKGDVELANEAALQFHTIAPAAPAELRLPLDIVRMEMVREMIRLMKRSEKSSPMDLPPVHEAMVKAGLQLAESYRQYSYYDEAKRVLNDAAFTESLRSIPEGDPNGLRERTNEARRDVARWADLKTQVQKVLSENKLDDPAGRMLVGKAFLGQLANLELAAPLLADGDDATLAAVAKGYAESQASPQAYLDLARALHQAAAPGQPEGFQAAVLTMGAEAAKRYLAQAPATDPKREEAERLARVLSDRAHDMRSKFFPAEALYRDGDPGAPVSSPGDALNWRGVGSPSGPGSSGYPPAPGFPGGPAYPPAGYPMGPGSPSSLDGSGVARPMPRNVRPGR